MYANINRGHYRSLRNQNSDKDLYSTPESDLNRIFTLCSDGKARALPAPRKITPTAPKEKHKRLSNFSAGGRKIF
tara:strand:+ start:8885 stop:9109 length:225 start_codon:yes stop_codon:yes gene_type:complete